ncbi:MAG: translation initiation factor IF-3 [bacterium]
MPLISKPEDEVRVNDQIKEDKVRLVTADGEQVGVMPLEEALKKAKDKDEDLVEVAPQPDPVVVKMMDYGKYKYEQQKARQKAKKKQNTMELKQLRLKPQIEEHDFNFKCRDAERFLKNNNKVKFQVFFRGRQITKPELGEEVLEQMQEKLEDYGKVVKEPEMQGHTMTMEMEPRSSKD